MVNWNNSTERRHNSLQKNTDVQSANFTLLPRVEYKHHHDIIRDWYVKTNLIMASTNTPPSIRSPSPSPSPIQIK